MINYILGNEFNQNAFKSGVNPTEGFNFNIAMYGETEEEIEGTELAAEFSFSSLQKFGQDFLEKLRGKKLNNPLLKKVNIFYDQKSLPKFWAIFSYFTGVPTSFRKSKTGGKISWNKIEKDFNL